MSLKIRNVFVYLEVKKWDKLRLSEEKKLYKFIQSKKFQSVL